MKLYYRQLDYTITDPTERMDLLNTILFDCTELDYFFENKRVADLLENMANYVFFSMRAELGNSIRLNTKHGTFSRKSEESLDKLSDDPKFDKTQFQQVKRSVYNKPSDPMRPEERAKFPALEEFCQAIELLKLRHEAYKAHEEHGEPLPEHLSPLSSLEIYNLKHLIIELQREQYVLRDIFAPRVKLFGRSFAHTPNEELYYPGEGGPASHTIDFKDPQTIYYLLRNYGVLREETWDRLDCDMKYVLFDLEHIVDRTELTPDRRHILIRKIDKATNEQIREELRDSFGKVYDSNYISRVWRHEIAKKIARTAELLELEVEWRGEPKMWKTCTKCGKRKLRLPDYFGKDSRTPDRLQKKCKMCVSQE